MFGYLRPFKDELKYKYVKDYKRYYCSVCNGLKKEFGSIYSGLLNYEVVFLYLFIEGLTCEKKTDTYRIKCYFNPFYKEYIQINLPLLDYVCFINYYLAMNKVKDNATDDNSIIYKSLYQFLKTRRKYQSKNEEYGDIVQCLDEEFMRFSNLENEGVASFDELASSMGRVLKIIVLKYMDRENLGTDEGRKKAGEIGFHLGEWIYLLDALDDYYEDQKKKRFNPLAKTLVEESNEPEKENIKRGIIMVELMTKHIQELCREIKFNSHAEIISNILGVTLEKSLKEVCRERFRNLMEENENESDTREKTN